jgi:hypothetical protein
VLAPTAFTAPLATGVSVPRARTVNGIAQLAGDDDALFFITAEGADALDRVRTVGPVAVLASGANGELRGPVIDAGYVYWFDTAAPVSLWRASRTGDGSDAARIATDVAYPTSAATFAGYVWWASCGADCTLYRVQSGSAVEAVTTGYQLLGASADALYLYPFAAYNAGDAIVARAADGTMTEIVTGLDPRSQYPSYFVADRGELFWRAVDLMYRAPATGGPAAPITGLAPLDEGDAFGVTTDHILYDFTPDGYQTAPR